MDTPGFRDEVKSLESIFKQYPDPQLDAQQQQPSMQPAQQPAQLPGEPPVQPQVQQPQEQKYVQVPPNVQQAELNQQQQLRAQHQQMLMQRLNDATQSARDARDKFIQTVNIHRSNSFTFGIVLISIAGLLLTISSSSNASRFSGGKENTIVYSALFWVTLFLFIAGHYGANNRNHPVLSFLATIKPFLMISLVGLCFSLIKVASDQAYDWDYKNDRKSFESQTSLILGASVCWVLGATALLTHSELLDFGATWKNLVVVFFVYTLLGFLMSCYPFRQWRKCPNASGGNNLKTCFKRGADSRRQIMEKMAQGLGQLSDDTKNSCRTRFDNHAYRAIESVFFDSNGDPRDYFSNRARMVKPTNTRENQESYPTYFKHNPAPLPPEPKSEPPPVEGDETTKPQKDEL